VSAQNRRRLYWSNIPNIQIPKDKKIFLKDIVLEDAEPVILHNLYGGFKEKYVRVFEDKSPTLRTAAGGGHIPSIIKKDLFIHPDKIKSPKFTENYVQWDASGKGYGSQDQRAYYLHKKHGALSSDGAKSHVKVLLLPEETVAEFFRTKSYQDFKNWNCIRKLHPIECERLQTLPDNYTAVGVIDGKEIPISNTQRYKMLGNGWTVDVIAHIFKHINW
jgi:site-specific DNA-cytosine methylase